MSHDLNLPGSVSTPAIHSDWQRGRLYMQGDSYPENSFELFSQVIDWVEAFLERSSAPLNLSLELVYLNTSSVKAMMDVFDLLEDAHQKGRETTVTWQYDPRNDRIAELAEEFKEDCSFPFAIRPLGEPA
ncbi:biofilm regulation phosphoprotein SiaC [Halomonas sp. YLGW01]|uniref:biofilm regulation phosphoprotein SiaC n=1 Tax=Halomonas sp. YLGW01 TaxID=2773308 RepID=UPI001784F978|nr:biofilm regulation phosphoprotein SiaC [Halomonas sp. YLGW01]